MTPAHNPRRARHPAWVAAGALAAWMLMVLGAGSAIAGPVQVEVLDGAGKPLPGAVVFLESPDARKAVKPVTGIEMAQEKRQFVPNVLVVPRGTEVRFPNHDSVRHHVYSFSPAKKFELKLYSGTPSNPVLFDMPGVVSLGCNIHDQMVGWILVVDTPYYGQTAAANGTVQMDNVPAGAYRLRAWHERLPVGAPALDQAITVAGAGETRATVRLMGLSP